MSAPAIRAALDAAEQHATADIWAGHPLAIILEALVKQTRAALAAKPVGEGLPSDCGYEAGTMWTGHPATPPAPEAGDVGDVGELVSDLNEIAEILCGMEKHLWAARLTCAAKLLQQQEVRTADLRAALRDCGLAVGSLIQVNCSDWFLLQVPAEVRLAMAKAAPPAPELDAGEVGEVWEGTP